MHLFFEQIWLETLRALCHVALEPTHDFCVGPSGAILMLMLIGPVFYFFNQDGDGLSDSVLKASEEFERAQRVLAWANTDTDLLVAEYYLAMAAKTASQDDLHRRPSFGGVRGTVTVMTELKSVPGGDTVVHVVLIRGEGLPVRGSNVRANCAPQWLIFISALFSLHCLACAWH